MLADDENQVKSADLMSLIGKYPLIWETVNKDIINLFKDHSKDNIKEFAGSIKEILNRIKTNVLTNDEKIKAQMTILALEKFYLYSTSKPGDKKVKFGLIEGSILQRLFFAYDFVRRHVSLFWYNILWNFIKNKNILMPLVYKKGIYCFYTDKLIKHLKKIIGNKKTLEIAAGDGTLKRFLRNEGVDIVATDNYSWDSFVTYNTDDVENMSAVDALKKYNPEIVICSWAPPVNNFEKVVFETESVKKYIVIGSKHKFASGNWDSYMEQSNFSLTVDSKLSKLVLPLELDNQIIIFERQ